MPKIWKKLIHSYNEDNYYEDHDNDFKLDCPGFDVYPLVIEQQPRVIAIGDIHGDMDLAIRFLKVARLIEETTDEIKRLLNNNVYMKEYIYKLKIYSNSEFSLENDINNVSFDDLKKVVKNQYEVVYRYYRINDNYHVKIIEDSGKIRWFKWTGGSTYVVQVGDQVDRCRPLDSNFNSCLNEKVTKDDEDSDLEIMLFYDSLDRIAKYSNGRVFSLLGNHEIMNVTGNYNYVSYKGLREHSPEPKDVMNGMDIRKDKFKKIIAKKMACTRSTILVIGDYLFVHGGIIEKLAYKYNLISINSIIRKFLNGSIKHHKDLHKLLNSSKMSPLWYRKLAYIPPDDDYHPDCQKLLDPTLENLNNNNFSNDPTIEIKGMVIGHTPQFAVFGKGITTACSNRIIRADIGASKAFDPISNSHDKQHRIPQVVEILTDQKTKKSQVKILIESNSKDIKINPFMF
jgi:hypothetical protein